MEELKKELTQIGSSYPARFVEKRGDIFTLDFTVAQRKAFLRTEMLKYSCRLKVDYSKKEVLFFEILKESGAGISSGGYDDIGTGFGFKVEKTKVSPAGREGNIKEQSVLFGKKYQYEFNFESIREDIRQLSEKHGFGFTPVLNEKLIR